MRHNDVKDEGTGGRGGVCALGGTERNRRPKSAEREGCTAFVAIIAVAKD